ncbi:hypothetical protein Bpfe_000704, partial [Biomphalaria pfeifferi]
MVNKRQLCLRSVIATSIHDIDFKDGPPAHYHRASARYHGASSSLPQGLQIITTGPPAHYHRASARYHRASSSLPQSLQLLTTGLPLITTGLPLVTTGPRIPLNVAL